MPLVPVSQRVGYTVQEVAQHNTPKSLWVIINRKVYDVTNFHKWHPGGQQVLLQMGGKDATAAAAAAHKNALPANLMWEYCIGSIVRFKVQPESPTTNGAVANSPGLNGTAPKAKAKPKAMPLRVSSPPLSPRMEGAAGAPSAAVRRRSTNVPPQMPPISRASPEQSPMASPQATPVQSPAASPRTSARRSQRQSVATDAAAPTVAAVAADLRDDPDADSGAELGSACAMDDEIARALAGDHAMRDATLLLVECIKEDKSLERFTPTVDAAALERQLGELLRRTFGGNDWPPGITVRRALVDEHLPHVLEAVWEAMKTPLPLGEDTLVAAFAQLTANAANGNCDRRISNFFEAIRDLLLVASPRRSPRAGSPSKLPGGRGDLGLVAGMWKSSETDLCIVNHDICTFADGRVSRIRGDSNGLTVDGWKVSAASVTEVKWDKDGKGMTWTRYGAAKDITPLVGVWKNSEGLVCVVADGECHFLPKGSPPFRIQGGNLLLNGWIATAITPKKVTWTKKGATPPTMEWNRIQEVEQVEGLDGTWSTSDGHTCKVEGGAFTFTDLQTTGKFAMKDGLPNLNSWRAVSVSSRSVTWRKGSKNLEWTRV